MVVKMQDLNLASNPWLERLRWASETVTDLEAHLADARRDRDELIVFAMDEGQLPGIAVARAARVSRGRVIQILAATEL